NGKLACQRHHLLGFGEQQVRIGHAGGLELLDDLLVSDPRVLLDLVEVEELLPGRGEILVGRNDRNERAERQGASDDEIAADRIEEERRQLVDQVVEELREEFALINLEADVINATQDVRKVSELQLDCIVSLDLDDARCGFLDLVGNNADRAHPLLAELVHLELQLRDNVALHRVERDCSDPEDRILHEHEEDHRQQLPALEQRQVERVADEAAELLAFDRDHRNDLGRRILVEVRQREAQQPLIQRIAEAAQHPLAEPALVGVDEIFEAAVDQDQRDEHAAQDQQVGNTVEFQPQQVLWKRRIFLDRLIDDRLRQIERVVKEWERNQAQQQQENLLLVTVLQD